MSVKGLGLTLRVALKAWGLSKGERVQGAGLRVQGCGLRVEGRGSRVEG